MEQANWSTGGKMRASRHNSDNRRNGSRRKRSKSKNGLVYLTLLVILLMVGAIYIGFKFTDGLLAIDDDSLLNDNKEPTVVETGPKKRDVLTVLLIGTDQRGREAARSDTLLLGVFDRKEKTVNLISIPRDTRTKIPGRGTEKVNHAHSYGGAKLTQETVEEMLDIKIDGYISTNFAGFANIVDIIGGVELDVERRMYYPDENINLHPGVQVLQGEDALGYVRYRSDGRGDVGRMERQQKFLRVLADQMLSTSNMFKIPSLIRELNDNVKTDISIKDMVTVANSLRTISSDNLHTDTLPGEPIWLKGVSYWQLDQKAVEDMLNKIFYYEEKEEILEE